MYSYLITIFSCVASSPLPPLGSLPTAIPLPAIPTSIQIPPIPLPPLPTSIPIPTLPKLPWVINSTHPFKYCPNTNNDTIQVSNITISPSPSIIGQNTTFEIHGNIGTNLTEGSTVNVNIALGFISFNYTLDLCNLLNYVNLTCPLTIGANKTISYTSPLPKMLPVGYYDLQVEVNNATGFPVSCIETHLNITAKK
ncbi:ML domain-containing protein [Globomyces pollinis-pini]|nr:ML domain-containing protein [Globomyces pollinis-pini]